MYFAQSAGQNCEFWAPPTVATPLGMIPGHSTVLVYGNDENLIFCYYYRLSVDNDNPRFLNRALVQCRIEFTSYVVFISSEWFSNQYFPFAPGCISMFVQLRYY